MEQLEHEWVTVPECCEYTRRSRWSVYRYIRRGMLRASQIVPGANILISRRSVEDMLHRRTNLPMR
jgi:excisionase family DNA binding protein